MDRALQKNLLDLSYQKYLVLASTSVIILFTYIIGVAIGFITHQISFLLVDITLLFFLSFAIIISCLFCFYHATSQLSHIQDSIRLL